MIKKSDLRGLTEAQRDALSALYTQTVESMGNLTGMTGALALKVITEAAAMREAIILLSESPDDLDSTVSELRRENRELKERLEARTIELERAGRRLDTLTAQGWGKI